MTAKTIIKRKIKELGYEFQGCCRAPADQKASSEIKKRVIAGKMHLLSSVLKEIESEEDATLRTRIKNDY